MIVLPDPLTPPDCDLQDFSFMPLHVARLRDSDLAAEELPEACWYAVLLWAAAWHQIPAASLPNNDVVLMRLCGLGRDEKTWKKHRRAALRGFIECSDGRLYHETVAEQAVSAWSQKLQQRWRTECARIRKANERNKTNDPTPTYEEWAGYQSRDVTRDIPKTSHVTTPPCHTDNDPMSHESHARQGLQGTGTGTGTGRISIISPAKRGSRLSPDFIPPDDWLDWACSERSWQKRDAEAEAETFRDYWTAKPGKDGTKLDWQATWRNWVRNSKRQTGRQRDPTREVSMPC